MLAFIGVYSRSKYATFTLLREETKIRNKHCIEYASDRLKNNKEFILQLLCNDVNIFIYLNDELKDDIDVVTIAIQCSIYNIAYVSERFRNNEEFMINIVRKCPSCIVYSNRFKNDQEFVRHFNLKKYLKN